MELKLKVGKKGYIIIPKAVREIAGIREGDEVLLEVGDEITLKPLRRSDPERLRSALGDHADRISRLEGAREPKPGELSGVHLEEEFSS
ncbi:MAG: AbrB/MazE/SpoVT family DNA-binding domain-containing protein [Candidatus Verstraetearchaeota archaeon]|nr:AbrB/MazE/SpoVT family DNA-binding domain-containing protein [Candidatus Verstraetearchaeota archaeon]